MRKKLTKTTCITIIAIVTILSLVLPDVIRSLSNSSLIGEESYYHLRAAQNVEKFGIDWNDKLVISNPEYTPNLIHFILAFLPFKEFFMRFIPIILGFLSVSLFYLILSIFRIGERTKLVSSLLLVLSPLFLYSFTIYSNFSFLIFFNLLTLFFFLKRKRILSAISFLPIFFISLPTVILTLITIILLSNLIKLKQKLIWSYIFTALGFALIVYALIYPGGFIPNRLFFFGKNIMSSLISDFGSRIGITIFHAILSIIGLIMLWVEKRKYKYYYIAFVAALISSTYFEYVLIFVNLAVSYFGSYAFLALYDRRWEIVNLKNITIMLIIYGILFSSISFGTRLVNSSPTVEEVNALKWLKTKEDGTTLSHYSNGYLIEFFADKDVLLDDRLNFLADAKKTQELTHYIYSSRNLQNTKQALHSNNISYIFIDNDMKDGLVWDKRNEGLLFLLDNSEDFERVYYRGGIEIWKVLNTTIES